MDFKLFMNSVEENLSLIKTEEELRNWIRNYARSIPEEERGSFLEQIQIRKSRSHNEILQELTDWCAKIEEGEITLSCSGYEEYGESWRDRDWVTEYEDPMGIGAQLKCYYEEAEQAVYDRDYESAGQMYWSLGVLNITADDVYGGEPAELGIEEMVSENLVSLNLKQIASLTLYSTYQAYELPERIPKLYGFFSWHMFENIGIEDMMSAGREPLQEINEFLEAWITYLREQNDSYTSRLLIEAVTFRGGTEGLLEEAKRTANQHPRLYIQVLEQFLQDGAWNRLRDEGMEALRRMNRNMEICDMAARMTAAAATHTGDSKTAVEALKEALCSKPTAANYFRILTCGDGCGRDDMKSVLELAEQMQQEQKERKKKMNKQWKVFDELTERCYTDMIRNTVNMVNWNSSFKLLTEIISDGRAGNPDFAKELYLLDDETDYEHDLQGWMEDYLGELEIREMYAELESVCRKLLGMFAWEEESPSDIRFLLASALEGQGKTQESLNLCREWTAKEPDNPYAVAALVYAKMNANDLEGAEEIVKQHISDSAVCDEDNDVIFAAAVRLYQKNGNKEMEKKMDNAREEYDKKLGAYLMGLGDEFEFGDEEEFVDDELPFN